MYLVFVMDSIERVDRQKDTTVGFLESAEALGHVCYHCLIHEVGYSAEGQVTAQLRRLAIGPGAIAYAGPRDTVDLSEVDAVFVRKDPPFDAAYHHATLLLEQLRGQTLVVNDPRGLREANEKLYALNFARHCPPMIVTNDRDQIHAFTRAMDGRAVIKPIDGAGGYGVMAVVSGDANARAIVDMLTDEGRRLAIVQAYLPEVVAGDKRVLLLDGEPLGAILRVPRDGDLRANIHVGGRVEASELSDAERVIVADMAPRLRADGLYFVGLDIIGERLTEVNVTSPTGIRELSDFVGQRVSDRVIDWVERRVAG
jgi:glutathione synthase